MALAPDAASVKAGKGQANPGKWPRLGVSDEAVWGEVKGSGSTPYQTRIDLRQVGYKCSCPSRKFPCKHALGLLLLHVRTPQSFDSELPPDWVQTWLDQRDKKVEKQARKSTKPMDAEAQRKRVEKRISKVTEGASEMRQWLKDLLRSGLATLPGQESAFWTHTAARMVDAQAPGLASMVRTMGTINYASSGWEKQAWEMLTQLYLAVEGFRHRDQLETEVQEDIKAVIGWTCSQEEIKKRDGIEDVWGILGKQEFQEDRLTVVKYWLRGEKSDRYALILQFVAPGQPRDQVLLPGTRLEAELVYYPGNYPLRAIVKAYQRMLPFDEPSGYDDLGTFEQAYASAVAANPWLNQLPVVFTALTPVMVQNELWLLDKNRKAISVSTSEDDQWKILALSGGEAIRVGGVVEDHTLHPLGMWAKSEYQLL